MTFDDQTPSLLAEEERGAAANALAARIARIETLPLAPMRARLCAGAFMAAGYGAMRLLEGDAETARQLRRMAEMIEAEGEARH